MSPELWICWAKPINPPPSTAVILSFLSPDAEEAFRSEWPGRFIFGWVAAVDVKRDAREVYLDLVARIGCVKLRNGKTFRQALARPGHTNAWWYHPVSFKDCEREQTFNWFIVLFTIRKVAASIGSERLILAGAPSEIANVLKAEFAVRIDGRAAVKPFYLEVCRAFISRLLFYWRMLMLVMASRNLSVTVPGEPGILLAGFWDWSLDWNQEQGRVIDRYYKRLPEELRATFNCPVGWLVWIDPSQSTWRKGLRESKDVIVLQSFLGIADVLRETLDLRPLGVFLRARYDGEFQNAFVHDGRNYFELFRRALLTGFIDSNIINCDLIALATERSCEKYMPKLTFHFLEHFPHARAHYDGVDRSSGSTVTCAVQHASYCHEKTFLFVRRDAEFNGEPDGEKFPRPNFVCAMGPFAKDLFRECGYKDEDVLATGSPRYDEIEFLPTSAVHSVPHDCTRVLMIASLNVELEIDVLSAVFLATRGLSVDLVLRNHPLGRLDRHKRFTQYQSHVEIDNEPLNESIDAADLVLFSYSTAAEEAFLRGKPVWQWLPIGFNGSALTENTTIPQFGSVDSLREALLRFQKTPDLFAPAEEARREVLSRLFYAADGRSAERIAIACKERMKAHVVSI
jgi:surface carbohydrate biosynthesis protein (TIGR04326 family)